MGSHKWTHPVLTPTKQAGTRFIYPEGWKAELSYRWLVTCRDGLLLTQHRRRESNSQPVDHTPDALYAYIKPCPHCRRKVRLSPNSATVAVFCDCLTFLRQCGQGLNGVISQTTQLLYYIFSCWSWNLVSRFQWIEGDKLHHFYRQPQLPML